MSAALVSMVKIVEISLHFAIQTSIEVYRPIMKPENADFFVPKSFLCENLIHCHFFSYAKGIRTSAKCIAHA